MNDTPRIPSPQQQGVIDFVANERGSAFVEAVAGAGKTTTLVDCLAVARGSIAFAAYNKKIADEIKARVAPLNLGNKVRVGTFHSFGLGTWGRAYPNVKSGPEAADEKWTRTVKALDVPMALEGFTRRLLSLAKQTAIGLHGAVDDQKLYYDLIEHFDMAYDLEDEALVPQGIELAIRALRLHVKHAPEIVDFDDMIYMPVVSGIRMWQNDVVFVDEAQDTNPIRRAYVRKMLNPRYGRAIFVGDRHQAIYGFTGADNDAVDRIIRDFNCKQLPLTVTYRCPKAVVAKAQEVVSHIQAHDSAPEGEVSVIDQAELLARATAKSNDDIAVDGWIGMNPTDAILCRKTKPLVELAFGLIRANVACHVEGRDIGAGLTKLLKRFKSAKTVPALLDRMNSYGERQSQKLIAKGKEGQAEALLDRIATVACIADKCSDVREIEQRITSLFEDSDNGTRKQTLTLSTVHKAKGREWPRVFVLGKNAWMPGPWARQAWEVEQEMNLIYVAYTRAQQELILVNVPAEKV